MADITGLPVDSTDPFNADVYWRYASEGDEHLRLVGTFGIGIAQKALIPIPATADVVLKALPRGPRGTYQHALAADGPSHTVNVPGIGGGGTGSSYYQTLRQNHGYSYGTTLPQEGVINLLQSFRMVDDPASGETDLYTFGVPTGQLNLRTDKNASGQIAVTTGSGGTGSSNITLAATLDLQPGQGIYVQGAGVSGVPLITTCTAVSADGLTITLASGPFSTFSGTIVQADDTAAVQAWVNAKGDLAMPPGYYRLTSSIVLPTTSEGFSIIIHGSGWDQSQFVFQHGGDGFVPTAPDLKLDSVVFKDLTIATGTIGDTSATIDANSKGMGIRWTAPSYTGIYNNFVLQRCRLIGWGRFAIWSDNIEVSWISECIFRENKSGHIAFVGPDTISPNKQPNANTLTNCAFDQAVGVSDSKRTVSGSMTGGLKTLTASGFTAADRGKFVIVHGVATGSPPGDLYTFIDSYQSSTQVTLAHQAQNSGSGTVEIFPTNVASILLNRANDTVLDGSTIQGNFVGTSPTQDVNAIKVYNSANCRFVGIHEEDNAGWGGPAVRMENCISMDITNWGGTSGDSALQNAHNSDFQLINCHCISVRNSFFNDRPQFVIDSTSSEVQIDDSFVVGYINLWQQDKSWDKLRIGSGVRVYQSADPRTNQVGGNEYLYDSLFGRDLVVNGRFLDGTGGLEGWTTDATANSWWSNPASSNTRYGSYIGFNVTGITDSPTPKTVFSQQVVIPNSLPAGLFTLAFDWYIASQSGVEQNGRYVEVRLHPSTGIDEALQFTTRAFTFVTGVWQSGQIRCWLGSGTSRNIDIQFNVTPGPNVPVMRLANLRLTPGKHSFGSWERAVHDFGGRMRTSLEFNPVASSPPPSPPPSGVTALLNIGGVLNVGSATGWNPIGTGTTGGVTIDGTPNRFAMFRSDRANVVDAPILFDSAGGNNVHVLNLPLTIDRQNPLRSIYTTGQKGLLALLDSDDAFYFGPEYDSAATTGGADVIIRAGKGSPPAASSLQIKGSESRFTFNAARTLSAATTASYYFGLENLGLDGVKIQHTQSGLWIGYMLSTWLYGASDANFATNQQGDIVRLKALSYNWPSSLPAAGGTATTTAGVPKVLGYVSLGGSGAQAQLQWMDMVSSGGITGIGIVGRVPRITATSSGNITTLGNSGIGDDLTTLTFNRDQFEFRPAATDSCDLTMFTNTVVYAKWRYEHRTGFMNDPSGNPQGEMQLYLNSAAASCYFGQASNGFTGGVYITPPLGYTGRAFEARQPGSGGTPVFQVDYDGNLSRIRSKDYFWPTTIPYPTGGAMKVLGYTTTSGVPLLGWLDPPAATGGITGTGVVGRVPRITATASGNITTLGNSGIGDDLTTLTFNRDQFEFRPAATNSCDLTMFTNTVAYLRLRYERRGGSFQNDPSGNPEGEYQLYFNAAASSVYFGQKSNGFTGGLYCTPPSGYTTPVIETRQPGAAGTVNFQVNYDGNISKIKQVSYVWPGSNTAGVLTNNGSGTLTWTPGGGGGGITGTGTMTTNYLPMWVTAGTTGTITNSPLHDLGGTGVNAAIVCDRDYFYGRADGVINLGIGSNRIGGIYVKNNFWMSSASTDPNNPTSMGFVENLSGGCTRFLINNATNAQAALQSGGGYRTTLASYNAIELRGGTLTSTPAIASASGDTFGVLVWQQTDRIPLFIGSQVTITGDLMRLQNNGTDEASFNANGTLKCGGIQRRVLHLGPASGTTYDLNTLGRLDSFLIVCDLSSGSFFIKLPPLSGVDGRMFHIVMKPKSSANTVGLMIGVTGDDINEALMTTSSVWTLHCNVNAERYSTIIADYNGGVVPNWRLVEAGLGSP